MCRLLRWCLTVLILAFAGLGPMHSALAAESRTALVIGNADYQFAPLDNPVNDATAIARALSEAGFNVIFQSDVSQDGMQDAIRAFGEALRTKGGVGLFYYAGHGVQLEGENYLLPIGDGISDEVELKSRSVNVSEAVDAMAGAHGGLNIVILDACRNNPLSGGTTKGLSRIDSNDSLFVSYSTSPGAIALDGDGVNSPYTKHLASAIETPGLNLEETFKRTLKGVYRETGGRQTPWISSSFFGDFIFIPGQNGSNRAQTAALAAVGDALAKSFARAGPARQISGVYRTNGTNPNGSRYSGMVTITPENSKVRFNWWIGRNVFTGVGEFAGRMLVVNWGDTHPVVYTFTGGDRLEGEWADGSAEEDLTLYARAAQNSQDIAEGRYSVVGRNPNGSTYTGTVDISRQGNKFTLVWKVGSDTYRGVGALEGNVLTVDWGDTTPVVYALAEDGSLRGLWSRGRGEETLTPRTP